MSLADFDRAVGQEGYLYELANGVIEVSNVPSLEHGRILSYLRNLIGAYCLQNPQIINYVAGGSDSKVLVETTQSERHPDLSIYLRPPSIVKSQPWDNWIPDIVVEIVSNPSRKRDYDIKPDEYLAFGVKEYWLIDAAKQQVVLHTRVGGRFVLKTLKLSQKYETGLLPGLKIDFKHVFQAN